MKTATLLSLTVVPAVVGYDRQGKGLRSAASETARSLQFGNIANSVCSTLGNAVGLACGCDLSVIPPALSAGCSTQGQVCAPGNILCGTPGGSFNFNPLSGGASPLGFEVCFDDMAVVNVPVNTFQLPFFSAGGLCIEPLNLVGGVGADAVNETSACSATLNATSCSSCELCLADGLLTGVTFDCENVQAGVISSYCSPMGIAPGISAESENSVTYAIFLPMFDALADLSANATRV